MLKTPHQKKQVKTCRLDRTMSEETSNEQQQQEPEYIKCDRCQGPIIEALGLTEEDAAEYRELFESEFLCEYCAPERTDITEEEHLRTVYEILDNFDQELREIESETLDQEISDLFGDIEESSDKDNLHEEEEQ